MLANLLEINPVVLFLSFLTIKIKNKQGILLPIKLITNADNGDNALDQMAELRASGIAILLSQSGKNATIKIASHTHEEKEFEKYEIILFIK